MTRFKFVWDDMSIALYDRKSYPGWAGGGYLHALADLDWRNQSLPSLRAAGYLIEYTL